MHQLWWVPQKRGPQALPARGGSLKRGAHRPSLHDSLNTHVPSPTAACASLKPWPPGPHPPPSKRHPLPPPYLTTPLVRTPSAANVQAAVVRGCSTVTITAPPVTAKLLGDPASHSWQVFQQRSPWVAPKRIPCTAWPLYAPDCQSVHPPTVAPWATTPGPTTSTNLPAPAATTPVRASVFLPPCPLNWPALPLPPHHLPLSPQTPPAAAAAGGPPQLPPRPGCCCGCCCHCCCCHVMFCGGLGYCCCAPG